MTLAVRLFPHPHIALLDEILKEWDIDQKSYSVITDNGSNMVKAIQSDVEAFVNYAKILAYNAILKFPDNGPIMLRIGPIMLKVAPIMLKVLALFLSNLCTLIQKKKKEHDISYLLLYWSTTEVSM